MRRLRRFTLAGQLLVAQMAILLTVLVTVALVSLAQSEATFTRTEGRRVFAIAEQIASTPVVREELVPEAVISAMPSVVQGAITRYSLSVVSVADTAGVVKKSSDPTSEGEPLRLGSPNVGRGASWTGAMEIGDRRMLVAQTPVLYSPEPNRAPDEPEPAVGTHLGTVMVAVEMPSIVDRLKGASSYLLTYLGIALALGGIGSWLVARRIKRQTLGLEPREIAGLAESREAMLYGLAEGVVALDTNNRITLVNNVAQRLLDLPERAVGMAVADLPIGPRLREVLVGETGDQRDQVVLRRGRVLVMNRMEVAKEGRPLGSVTTLRDRTELAALEREIGSFRSTTELLRAQAHEFANQLHTISGLIQLGEYDEVVRYVDSVSEHRAQLDLTLARTIKDTAISALVMAKAAQAAERRVELRVSDDTSLGRVSSRDSADLSAVVGNLVDNAIDAAATTGGVDRWVELAIHQDEGTPTSTVEVVVSDSGPGVGPELVTEVFTHGFTTKAAEAGERGIGLALTRLICQRRGGEVEVERTPSGATFIARLTVEPAAVVESR
ncbi:ATP-binding protein [Intrasporangium sp.]|uniref:sensor histidine kinase n=1 Tax=Intrasporangium sp. TaxID=1925024 RepID=UPI0033658306